MAKRIWELDALRGLCIIGMVAVHAVYDLAVLYRMVPWQLPGWFTALQNWGAVAFLLISGTCVTLGSRHMWRGFAVFSCGMVCTLVTLGMYALGMGGSGTVIWFGVLHCLGCCMLLWGLFRKIPASGLLGLGLILASLGLYLQNHVRSDFPWLIPFGIMTRDFVSADYFPLLPYLGFFLMGSFLGRTLYQSKTTLLPNADPQKGLIRFLCLCGKHSLPIYLLHQPVMMAVATAIIRLS